MILVMCGLLLVKVFDKYMRCGLVVGLKICFFCKVFYESYYGNLKLSKCVIITFLVMYRNKF